MKNYTTFLVSPSLILKSYTESWHTQEPPKQVLLYILLNISTYFSFCIKDCNNLKAKENHENAPADSSNLTNT